MNVHVSKDVRIPMRSYLKVAETFISGMNKVTETPKMGVEWHHENFSINLHDTSRYMAEILLIRRKHQPSIYSTNESNDRRV